MYKPRCWSGALWAAAALLWGAGCQPSVRPLTPVTGKVSYKGHPLQSGAIVFTPDGKRGETGRIAFGKIATDGTFVLYTGETAGAAPGFYRVTVLAHGGDIASGGARFPQPLLPDKYRDPNQSELGCEVKANRPNMFDFPLE